MAYVKNAVVAEAERVLSSQPSITLREIARRCGVSTATMSRALDAEAQAGYREWRTRRLLTRAHALLVEPGAPRSVKEVAVALGFQSGATFTRWFRHHTRMTPSRFRNGYSEDLAAPFASGKGDEASPRPNGRVDSRLRAPRSDG
jgi:AraC-like DNA-binding protein